MISSKSTNPFSKFIQATRAQPQVEIDFDQIVDQNDWPDMDQSAEATGETWNYGVYLSQKGGQCV